MFPIIDSVLGRRDLAPGTYDRWKLAPLNERDPSLKAGIAHYLTDLESGDFKTRALVFGDESARISGDVVVNPDGSKTFKRVEIRPLDTDLIFVTTTGKGHILNWLGKQRDDNTIPGAWALPMTLNIVGTGGWMSRVQVAELVGSTIPSRRRS